MPGRKKLPQGGALIRQPEAYPEHVGELPKLDRIECLPPTELPLPAQTQAHECAMEAVQKGEATSLSLEATEQEPFSPPTQVPWGRESPAEVRGCPPKQD